jgi:hypothetical protein
VRGEKGNARNLNPVTHCFREEKVQDTTPYWIGHERVVKEEPGCSLCLSSPEFLMSLSPVYSIELDQDHRLSLYTPSPLCWAPPCCCWVCMAGSPRSLSIEPMQHFKANLPRVAVNAKEQYPALQTVAHPLAVAASVPVSVSVSVSVSACYCPSFFSPARSTGLCCHSAPPRREIRGCGLGFGHG